MDGGQTQSARLIVIEGIDGSGSTTQVHRLFAHLRTKGHAAFVTHEPSDGPVGMLIRLALAKRLLGPNFEFHDPGEMVETSGTALDEFTMALLFAADRADHAATQILPNLRRGRHVLSDRYLLSSLAYQGLTCEHEWLRAINRNAPRPDLTIFLDVDPEVAHTRMRANRWHRDLYEETDQQRLIRKAYHEILARDYPEIGPVKSVDAARNADEVAVEIAQVVDAFLATGEIGSATGDLALF
ncbi:MAG TPA: dTMP kinase [Longimicrobiaceae bacterium]|nr:dTMP kinase [Longimicrobiaceae bacterium]